MVKVYRGLADAAALDRLAAAHDDYVAALAAVRRAAAGTEIPAADWAARRVPVVVQEGLPDAAMMRPRMHGRLTCAGALALMEAAGEVHRQLLARAAGERGAALGFHPSIRNFAVIGGSAVFFDTFPPLIGYSRDEMGRCCCSSRKSR